MRRRSIIGASLACVVVLALVGFVAASAGTGPGSLDGSFGKGGKATIDFGGEDNAVKVALGPGGKIVATDIDAKKLALARAEAKEQGLEDIDFRLANLMEDGLQREYDLVHARFEAKKAP